MLQNIRTLACPAAVYPLPRAAVARAPLSSPDSCLRLAGALRLKVGEFSIQQCDGGFLLHPLVEVADSVVAEAVGDRDQLSFMFGPLGVVPLTKVVPANQKRLPGRSQSLIEKMLCGGWCSTEDLMEATKWRRTSIRATVARTGKKIAEARDGRALERRRIGKETSYRIARIAGPAR